MDLKPGDKVLYVPHHEAHHLDTDHRGEALFHFVHAEDAPGRHRKGDAADLKAHRAEGRPLLHRQDDGHLYTANGHRVRHGAPKKFWPATVREVYPDGTAGLDVPHPFGGYVLHYPDRSVHPAAPGVPHDPAKGSHTFHLLGE